MFMIQLSIWFIKKLLFAIENICIWFIWLHFRKIFIYLPLGFSSHYNYTLNVCIKYASHKHNKKLKYRHNDLEHWWDNIRQ